MENKTIFSNLNSFSDIVQAMVDGVKKEWVNIDMKSFGHSKTRSILGINMGEKCYGCAATNTLCELMEERFKPRDINSADKRAIKVNYGITTLELLAFENAIDYLRSGEIRWCLRGLHELESKFNFAIPDHDLSIFNAYLPKLHNDNYKQDLKYYQEYADKLRKENL
jgi:hypothetical protein